MPKQIYVAPETMADDYQEIKTCPYDPSHRVHAKRFLRHIMKCQKNYPNAKMTKCPFNATHIIPDEMYTAHLEICPDKAWLECQMPVITGDVSMPVSDNNHFNMSDGEDWDQPANPIPKKRKPVSENLSGFRPEDAPENFKRQMLNSIQPGITCQRRPKNQPRSAMRGRGINRLIHADSNIRKNSYGRGEPVDNEPAILAVKKTAQMLEDLKFSDAKDETAAEDPLKLKKKLEKKLRELKKLEEAKEAGLQLDDDQLTKLATKTEVREQLKAANLRCLK